MITNVYHVDLDLRAIMDAADSRIASATQIRWFLRDQFILALRFKRLSSTGSWDAVDLSNVVSFRAMLKATDDRDGSALVLSENAAFNVAGDWSEIAPATGCVAVRLDLNTAALIAKFQTSTESGEFVFEIEGQDAEGKISTLLQFNLTVIHDVVTGTEGAAPSTAAQYLSVDAALALLVPRLLDGGNYRLKDGKLQMRNKTDGKFHEWGFETKDGATAFWVGPGEA